MLVHIVLLAQLPRITAPKTEENSNCVSLLLLNRNLALEERQLERFSDQVFF